jgi:hypothetical protein
MREGRIAEWFLSQVTSSERAVSTVSDLMEANAMRSAVWFWCGVVRTVASLLWRGFVADPGRMLGLALRAWLLSLGLVLASLLGVIAISVFIGLAYGMVAYGGTGGLGGVAGGVTWLAMAAGLAAAILCEFQVGRWIARRAPDRELSACLTLTILQCILGAVFGLGFMLGAAQDAWRPDLLPLLWLNLPCLAGALWVRRSAAR